MQAADHFACSQVERHEVKSECSTVGELKHGGLKIQAVITGIIELPILGGSNNANTWSFCGIFLVALLC